MEREIAEVALEQFLEALRIARDVEDLAAVGRSRRRKVGRQMAGPVAEGQAEDYNS